MALYEIELIGLDGRHDEYYHTTIVEGPDDDAGRVPRVVDRHARLLRDIAGGEVTYRIGAHRPVLLAENDLDRRSAWTVWLTDETR